MTGTFGNRNASVSEKAYCLAANPSSDMSARIIEPVCVAQRGRYTGHNGEIEQNYEARQDGKTNVITTVTKDNLVAVPVIFQTPRGNNHGGMKYEKSPTLTANGAWADNNRLVEPIRIGTIEGAKTGLYACPIDATAVAESWDGKTHPVYTVANGLITIKNKQYPIKLPDGYYIIRKLTVKECMRLQTARDDYIFPVSNTQAYKMLGNGWTVDVIVHILSHIPNLQDYELEVLSLYDGMSCGNLALEKLGCKIARYVSYEIDKYCIKTTQANFPFVEQRGDAFQIRDDNWQY